MRTTERPRGEKPGVKVKEISSTSSANRKDEIAARETPSKKPASVVAGRDVLKTAAPRKTTRVAAPGIRLPNPEVQDHTPSPSPGSRTRTLGSTS